MSSTQPPHHQHHPHHSRSHNHEALLSLHQSHNSHHQTPSQPSPPPSVHQLPTTYGHGGGGVGSSSKTALGGPIAQVFADERREAISLPKIEADASSITSSHPSSPYSSPHLAPRGRAGAIGNMEEVTLPPIQAAVPMRRGAVSGASSGPSLPFPPIRLPYEEDDVPSRGPSPTLGKRSSFSMGHSNHVPPGPDVQLPTPVLSGSGERRVAIAAGPNYASVQSVYHGEGEVPRSEGPGNYYSSGQRPNLPWSQFKSTIPRSENGDLAPPYHTTHPISPLATHSSTLASQPARPSHFADDLGRAPYPPHPQRYPHHRPPSGTYRYDYQGGDSAMSPGSNHSVLHGESRPSSSPRLHSNQPMSEDHRPLQDIDSSSLHGKRPRSAPRVMSSQPRIFACSQCPARFARNHDLKRHQRGHLSVRPYPCNWCGKSFSRKDALKRHILVKGCGKDGKGGGGGKGEGKGKRSRGDEDGKRMTQRGESSGGDQEDGQFGEEDDDHDSEENNPDEGQGWEGDEGQNEQENRSHVPFGVKEEGYGNGRLKGTAMHLETPSFPTMTTAHRRPSMIVR